MNTDQPFSVPAQARMREGGAMALFAILILMAAALVIASGVSLRGITHLRATDLSRRGTEVSGSAEACVAEALRRLRDDAGYLGGTLSVGRTTCTVTVTDDGGGQRTMRAAGTRDQVTRHVRAVATRGTTVLSGRTIGTLTVTSWEETLE